MTDTLDFKKVLLSRHGENDTICVVAQKTGRKAPNYRFCSGVSQAAELVRRACEKENIEAIWANIRRLKPGSDNRRKGSFEAYTGIVVDIDRRWRQIHEDGSFCRHNKKEKETCGAFKCNATEEKRGVLRRKAEEINAFMSPLLGSAVFADSGNGYHIARRCQPLDVKTGEELYSRILALLRAKFEQLDVNFEIDLSLSDETQVTCPG